MAVFRVEKNRDYTVIANHHLRDKTLSLKAKGLLALMLSLPEGWDYSTNGLPHHQDRAGRRVSHRLCAGAVFSAHILPHRKGAGRHQGEHHPRLEHQGLSAGGAVQRPGLHRQPLHHASDSRLPRGRSVDV